MSLYNKDYEKTLLGCIAVDFNIMADLVMVMKAEYFFFEDHKHIYALMREMYDEGLSYNFKILYDKAKAKSYNISLQTISELFDMTYSAANFMFYVKEIKTLFGLRFLTTLSDNIKLKVGEKKAYEEIKEFTEKEFSKVDMSNLGDDIKDLKSIIISNVEELNKQKPRGISTGFPGLDNCTNGLQRGDLIILAARPSVGKTALALSIMANMILNEVKIGFISLEMTKDAIGKRFISVLSSVKNQSLTTKKFTAHDLIDIQNVAATKTTENLYIADRNDLRIYGVKSYARRMFLKNKIEILFIDYVGLIQASDPRKPLWENMNDISRELKMLSKELQIPIVALSQLNRDAEGVQASLNQIRGSGAFEQDADLVLFLNRERMLQNSLYGPNPPRESVKEENMYVDTEEKGKTLLPSVTPVSELKIPGITGLTQDATLQVAKNRNGPVGTINLIFEPEQMRFREKNS